MASLRELKTRWQIRFRDADRQPPYTTVSVSKDRFETRTAARKEARRLQVAYDTGEFDPWTSNSRPERPASGGPTLLEAVRAYVEAQTAAGERGEKGGWSAATAQRYSSTLEHFARSVGPGRPISGLRRRHIRRWTRREHLSEASRRTYHGMVAAFVGWLEEEGIADVDMPPRLEERRRLPAYATPAEVRRICEAWREIAAERAERNDDPSAEPTLWYIPAWKFAFWQALRKSEITALRVGAVDLDARRLRVGDGTFVPKGKDEATIPLVEPAAKIARAWGAGERPPGERLFRHDSPQYLARAFREARKRALPDKARLSLHGLRHGRCVDLLEKGKRLHIVQRFLRHKSLDATMRYVQIVDRSLREELDDLGESPLE